MRPLVESTAPIAAWLHCCLCEQEDVHIGAEAATHIGEEEIDPVQSIQPHARDQSISLHPLHALKRESKTTGDRGAWRCGTYRRERCARQARLDCRGGIVAVAGRWICVIGDGVGQAVLDCCPRARRMLLPGEFDAVGGFIS